MSSFGLRLKDAAKEYRVVRLPHDFYCLATGSEALRPEGQTDIPGLVLAGDYVKQPYLATMEGAVVSGKNAADTIQNGDALWPVGKFMLTHQVE